MMKRFFSVTCLVLSLAVSLCSCDKEEGGNTHIEYNPGKIELTSAQQKQVEGNSEFAFKLLKQVAADEKKSVFISPLSATYALAMLTNGAAGDTQKELIDGLGLVPANTTDINALCHRLMTEAVKLDKTTKLSLANGVVVNQKYLLKDAFKTTVEQQYAALVENKDFGSSATLNDINKWASNHTQGMIPKIMDELNPQAVVYIMNALYFKGIWNKKFEKSNTHKENFTTEDGAKHHVQMMHQNEHFRANANDVYQSVVLPYGNGSYQLVVLLPNEGKKVADVLDAMNAKSWQTNLREARSRNVDLKLPRFTTTYYRLFNDDLKQLGMQTMFNPRTADFSLLANASTFVSKVFQHAKIELDEEGTKAAAVTVVEGVMSAGPSERMVFHADHPFVYAITEYSTGTIFFMGVYQGD